MRAPILALAGAFALAVGCGGDDDGGTGGTDGATSGCMIDIGLFKYCGEYRGVPANACEQSGGTFYETCPEGYVGYCEIDANVNPKKTYFYGNLVTESAVETVCPGGKYHLGSGPPGSGGKSGSGGAAATGGKSGSGGSGGSGGKSGSGGVSASGGASSGIGCNELDSSTAASFLEETGSLAALPTLGGGAFVDGRYELTRFVVYGLSTWVPKGRKGVIVVDAASGTMEAADGEQREDGTFTSGTFSFKYKTEGITIAFETNCGPELGEGETNQETGTWAASGLEFDLLLGSGNTDVKFLWHYEKR